ncbi:MAG: GDYXXLXY domain-containing protein [Desulfobulbus sp.]|nr:GDYXXLXY domain-containing protein [Desulfobulbus sp.]
MRKILVAVSLVVFLAGFAWSVCTKEEQIKSGETLIVRLAPRDPRAFLLGDYMALNYAMNREVDTALSDRYTAGENFRSIRRGSEESLKLPRDGVAVVRLDANKVASFVRLDDGGSLGKDERCLYFRVRGFGAHIAASAFYFQEGAARDFDNAQYGELRVDADGKSLLVHLLDDKLARIQPQKVEAEERQ